MGRNTEAAEKIESYLDRIERLLEEIEGLKDDLKDVKLQARDDGFNVAALLRLVAIRRDRRRADLEVELLNDLVLYAHATGMPLDIAPIDDGTPADRAETVEASPHRPDTKLPEPVAGE